MAAESTTADTYDFATGRIHAQPESRLVHYFDDLDTPDVTTLTTANEWYDVDPTTVEQLNEAEGWTFENGILTPNEEAGPIVLDFHGLVATTANTAVVLFGVRPVEAGGSLAATVAAAAGLSRAVFPADATNIPAAEVRPFAGRIWLPKPYAGMEYHLSASSDTNSDTFAISQMWFEFHRVSAFRGTGA